MNSNEQQILNDLRLTIERQKQQVEEAQPRIAAARKEQQERSEEIIASLNTRIAEYEDYKRLSPAQQFFYRLFHRPSWL